MQRPNRRIHRHRRSPHPTWRSISIITPDPRSGLDLPEIATPDPLYFQQASMLMLSFRFEGTRKVVASRLLIRDDFVGELLAHLPVLDKVYPDWDVSAVQIVSFQKGAFYYDDWPGAMDVVRAYREYHAEPEHDAEAETLPDDATPARAESEAA